MDVLSGKTGLSVPLRVLDATSTVGAGLAGLTATTASLSATYWRQGGGIAAITLATTLSSGTVAWASGGFVQISATGAKGHYRLDVPDAVCATGAEWAVVELYGASGMVPVQIRLDLQGYDPKDRPPTATEIAIASATQVRAELTTELGRIDVDVSSRFSATGVPTNFSALSIATSGGVSVTTLADRVINATNYATGFQPTTTGNLPTNFGNLSIATSGYVTIAGTATGAITASSFGAGAVDATALATSAAGKINQYTAGLRGGAAFSNFRFSMLATSGTGYATNQAPAISIGFGTAAAVTVTNAVTAIGNDYVVSFTATELPAGQMGIMRATATGALTREISIIATPAT